MRLTSEIWVSALVRRVFSAGGFAAVIRRGASEAGAIFVVVPGRAGLANLYGPAPQTAYGDEAGERQFDLLLADVETDKVDARVRKEVRFDDDVWVVEIEPAPLAVEELIRIAASGQ